MKKTTPMTDTVSSVLTALRLDRARRRWRLLALVAVAILALCWLWSDDDTTGDHIAVVQLTGFIDTTLVQQQTFHDIADNKDAKALLVYIDSPGGSVTGGMDIFSSLRSIAERKPVVAVMGNMATSAGYLAALGADYIIANEASITGSVGVLMPLVDATGLAQKLGIKSEEITSGKLKTVTSPLYKRSVSDTAYLQDTVNDLNAMFLTKVKERRKPTPETMKLVSDARVLSGRTAKALGLVDELGGYTQAIAWLQGKKVGKNLPEYEYSLEEESPWYQKALQGAVTWPQERLSQWLLGM